MLTQYTKSARNRATGGRTVRIVRVREAQRTDGVGTTEFQRQQTSTFKVADDTHCSVPVLKPITVEDSCKPTNCKGNVRPRGDGKVVETADKGMVEGAGDPGSNIRWDGE
jgi:hypothetical protein